jgi:pyruvate dehydrogenase E2 component (dihydrolipoyllysine-residue acetyltransferase)
MAKEVRLPQLGQTMEEGTVVNCVIKVGDEVKKGDVIFEIETDKATIEMESPADGFVKHILAAVEQTLPIGAPLLVLGGKDEEVPQSFVDSLTGGAPAAAEAAPAAETPPVAEPAEVKPEPTKPAGRVMASPRAKKLGRPRSRRRQGAQARRPGSTRAAGGARENRAAEQDTENNRRANAQIKT